MSTKRVKLDRPRRGPPIGPEALALFIALDKVPLRRREDDDFRIRERELHRLLDLVGEWFCSSCSVLDRDEKPCWPEGYPARDDWFKVRAVRELLLEAARGAPLRPRNRRPRETYQSQ